MYYYISKITFLLPNSVWARTVRFSQHGIFHPKQVLGASRSPRNTYSYSSYAYY